MESPVQGHSLCFISWNTNGIKSTKDKAPKLPFVLNELQKQKANVAFLQETHIGPDCYQAIQKVNGWWSYFTVYSPRSKGVAILVNKKTTFRYICHDEDHSGGYIVLFCHLYGQLYTLVNIYNHKADRDMLNRLNHYLRAIKTKGMLVVGGDFNTVLDPNFDRMSSSDKTYHSSLRSTLENFTDSMNLMDVFAHTHPRGEGFTRFQNLSKSRLDMFFIPTNTLNSVICCKSVKADKRICGTGEKRISDHDPLIMKIKVPSKSVYKMPEVSSMLGDFEYNGKHKVIRAGKINSAEILSSIRSLSDSNQQTPDNLSVRIYKNNDLAITEKLKLHFNLMLKTKYVYKCITESFFEASSKEHCFNVDYLIFAQIFAKRLKVFLTPSFRSKKKVAHAFKIWVTLAKGQQNVNMSFLKNSILSLKKIHPSPPKDFTILKYLLPRVSRSHVDYIILRQGCPLTRPILTLVLKKLGTDIIKTSKTTFSGNTSICHFRQSLMVCANNENIGKIFALLNMFPKCSGIKIKFKNLRTRYSSLKNVDLNAANATL